MTRACGRGRVPGVGGWRSRARARRGLALATGAWLAWPLGCGGPPPDQTAASLPPLELVGGDPSQEPAGPPRRGDWLVLHMLSDPENLNPYTSSDRGTTQVANWVFQTLLTVDPDTLEQIPLIASRLPEISEDQLVYRFTLRPEVTFSDGRPLTSEDVEFSLKVIRHPKVAAPHLRNYFESLGDVERQGPHAVRIALRQVYFRNIYTLGSFEILPRHHYDPENLLGGISLAELNDWDSLDPARRERAQRFATQFNEDFLRRPLGSGAYVLEDPERDWKTGEQIVLRRRDGFWAAGNSKLGDGWVERVVYRIVNDPEAALVSLKAGNLDALGLTPLQARRGTVSDDFVSRFGKQSTRTAAFNYLGWNARRPIFADKRVRQALSHLVDKQNLVEKVMLGLAKATESPIFSGRPEHHDDLPSWPYSPARAAELLAEAGWRDSDGDGVLDREIDGERVPLRFELISNAGNDLRKKVGLAVIDSFKRVGIDASFRSLDWTILLEKMDAQDFDAVVLGWGSSAVVPPDSYQLWHSSQAVKKGSNYVGFRNAEADAILERYRVTFDEAERIRLYRRFQEIVYEEQPYTFLFEPESVTAWDRRFGGVRWYEGIGSDLFAWWVPAERQKY